MKTRSQLQSNVNAGSGNHAGATLNRGLLYCVTAQTENQCKQHFHGQLTTPKQLDQDLEPLRGEVADGPQSGL